MVGYNQWASIFFFNSSLVNVIPSDHIAHRQEPLQGDLISLMLFILVMDVLGHMILMAKNDGLLQPLSRHSLQHRISIYADDVVMFLIPEASDIAVTLFGEATGHKKNLQKSNVLPIRYDEVELAVMQNLLPYELIDFLSKYLGLT